MSVLGFKFDDLEIIQNVSFRSRLRKLNYYASPKKTFADF